MEDINYNISLAIEDILSLINYCSTDKKTRNLCTKRSFWQEQFNRFRLPLDDHIQYDNPYEWIQLLLKTKYIMNKLSTSTLLTIFFKENILLTDILNVIKNGSDLQTYYDDDYNLIVTKLKRCTKYKVSLITNKSIREGVEFLQNSDEVLCAYDVKEHKVENILINLISYI